MRYFKKEISSGRPDVAPAVLECYLLDMSPKIRWKDRPAVVICAGGAYSFTNDRESEPIAMMFLSRGFHVFSLRYSCERGIYPTALQELARTVSYIRGNATELYVDPSRIVVAGFSAGGHLAAQYCCCWNNRELMPEGAAAGLLKPDLLVLGYPVITCGQYTHEESVENLLGALDSQEMRRCVSVERLVSDAVPPVFLWHTRTDPAVPVQNSLLFAQALTAAAVPYELHIYPFGGHGLGLSNRCTIEEDRHVNDYCRDWPAELDKFMQEYLHLGEFDGLAKP